MEASGQYFFDERRYTFKQKRLPSINGFLQWRYLCCQLKRLGIFASKESSHRQTNKVKILAATGLIRGRYSIFTVLTVGVYRNVRIIRIVGFF